MRHPDGRCTVIPAHSGEIIGPGLFNKILKDIEFAEEDLLRYLKSLLSKIDSKKMALQIAL